MKIFLLVSILAVCAIDFAKADGQAILAAARSQIGVPYAWGGGGFKGKSLGTNDGQGNDDSHVVGFDCSGLAQYAVYHGANKIIARVSAEQYKDPKCHHVPIAQKQPGDLIFWYNGVHIHHVAIVSNKPNEMVEAPESKKLVREVPIRPHGLMSMAQRCW